MIAAAVAGQGVAIGRRPLVDELVRTRRLVAPFRDTLATPRAYLLVVDPAARARPAVRALEAWLLQQAAAEAAAAASSTPRAPSPPRRAQRC